jgi:hypothetical protein
MEPASPEAIFLFNENTGDVREKSECDESESLVQLPVMQIARG